jgi:N4-gp56 family major capsid protein
MAQTNISTISPQAAKVYGSVLFAQTQQSQSKLRLLGGKKPSAAAEIGEKIGKVQSSADLPIVEVYDLASTAGDEVTVDCQNVKASLPVMGDEDREGKGDPVTMSSMKIRLDMWSFVADAGKKMSRQRTGHDLMMMAQNQGKGNAVKYWEQRSMYHLGGARGTDYNNLSTIPLESHSRFAKIMVNPIKAPTFNRHFVVDGGNLIQGGQQLASIDSTDVLKIDHVDQARAIIDAMPTTLQPIKLPDDMSAGDSPMWALLTPSNVFATLKLDPNFRQLQAEVNARAAATGRSNHPLFVGDVGMWNGILVIKITSAVIRFLAGTGTNIVTQANAGTATESQVIVNAGLTAGYAVERSILLGAQALGVVYGKSEKSGGHYSLLDRKYDYDSGIEYVVEGCSAAAKLRFDTQDGQGNLVPTDHGVMVIDSAAKQYFVS